ncbi:MAG: TIM barrel protein, partial [Chloroflexota bacterium]|nr:TIM barrel protein [Chloroflexota bacterium]
VQHSLDLVNTDTSASRLDAQAMDVRAAVAAHGLELHSTFTGLAAYSSNLLLAPDEADRQASLAWYRTVIGLTSSVGGRAAGGHVGCFSVPDWGDPARRAALWSGLQDSLAELAAEAMGAGLEYLMVENLAVAREPSTMAMISELLTEGDARRVPIRPCLDVGHMCVPGTSGPDRDPYAWLRSLGPSAPVVQLQQSDTEGDHHWPFTDRYNAVGRIAADRVIDALGEGGIEESALLLEVIPPFEQPDDEVLDDLLRSVEYWREALDRRGVLAD